MLHKIETATVNGTGSESYTAGHSVSVSPPHNLKLTQDRSPVVTMNFAPNFVVEVLHQKMLRLIALSTVVVSALAQSYTRSYQPAGAECGHQTGYVFESTKWQTGVTQPTNVFMTYGPYATDAPLNATLQVTFTLQG